MDIMGIRVPTWRKGDPFPPSAGNRVSVYRGMCGPLFTLSPWSRYCLLGSSEVKELRPHKFFIPVAMAGPMMVSDGLPGHEKEASFQWDELLQDDVKLGLHRDSHLEQRRTNGWRERVLMAPLQSWNPAMPEAGLVMDLSVT